MKRILILLWCLSLYSCKKDKKSVPADVAVYVKHHGALIPGAKIYVKHNASEFPGTDPASYDDSATAGTEEHAKGHAHFEGLNAGTHYFYSTGYDSTIMEDVMGGISLTVEEREEKQELTLDIPVTE
jgi:hypothetical protein